MNITTLDGFDAFKSSVTGPDRRSRVDLVLSCVDNYEARMTINQVGAASKPSCSFCCRSHNKKRPSNEPGFEPSCSCCIVGI